MAATKGKLVAALVFNSNRGVQSGCNNPKTPYAFTPRLFCLRVSA
jgi:hypothetical protein